MWENETRFRTGVAVLALAGALLVGMTVASVPFAEAAMAVAVVAAYAGAVLVGSSVEGRPV